MVSRVLLKLSGEALMGDQEYGIDQEATLEVAHKVKALHDSGVDVAIVTGAGNIFRGIQGGALGIDRTPADQMGMLATLINGTALKQALKKVGLKVRLFSALPCPSIAMNYQWDHAMKALQDGYVLLFVGGTGHPYFTTDTCAALRASEIKADLLLKATMRVDGIYDKDPRKHEGAKKYERLTYTEMLDQKLGIIDLTAATLCMENNIPTRVYNFNEGSLVEALSSMGTLVTGDSQ